MKLIAMNTKIADAALDAAWSDLTFTVATCDAPSNATGPFRQLLGSCGAR